MPSSERALALEALYELSKARFLVKHRDFSKWNKHLGTAHVPSENQSALQKARAQMVQEKVAHEETAQGEDINEQTKKLIQDISKTVKRVARHTPFTANCLPQACAAQMMLKRRNIMGGQIFIGGKINKSDPLPELHAWLKVQDIYVTGDDIDGGLNKFKTFIYYQLID